METLSSLLTVSPTGIMGLWSVGAHCLYIFSVRFAALVELKVRTSISAKKWEELPIKADWPPNMV